MVLGMLGLGLPDTSLNTLLIQGSVRLIKLQLVEHNSRRAACGNEPSPASAAASASALQHQPRQAVPDTYNTHTMHIAFEVRANLLRGHV